MSKLLLNEQPLLIMPQLAVKIGLNESVIIQQIHYWNEINKKLDNNYKDNNYWTFNSVEQWKLQFPFWSSSTIKRAIAKLQGMKLIVTGNYNKYRYDKTKWYRIDYKVLEALENTHEVNMTQRSVQNDPIDNVNMIQPIPEINPETNSENNCTHQSEIDESLYLLIEQYTRNRFGEPLRNSKHVVNLDVIEDCDYKDLVEFFDKHIKDYDQCNLDYISTIQYRAM